MRFFRQTLLSVCLILSCAFAFAQPVALDDNATTNEDTPVTFNVLLNDDDPSAFDIDPATVDLDLLTGGIDQGPIVTAEGTFSVDASGDVTFTPVTGFNGTTTPLAYTVNNNNSTPETSPPAEITVTVNDLPTISTIADQTIAEDNPGGTGPIPFTIGDTETPGSLTLAGVSDNITLVPDANIVFGPGPTVTVTPEADQFGIANITVTVSDGNGGNTPTSFQVTVTAVNDDPVAVDDNTSTNEDTPATLNVTTNDTDVDGTINAATVDLDPATGGIQTTFSNAAGGWVVVASGAVTYTPVLNYNTPPASITYTVNDNDGVTSNTGTFTVSITAVNDAPVAVNNNTTTIEDTPVTLNVTTNDTDVDGTINAGTVDLDPGTGGIQTTFSNAAGGWSVVASGAVTYTPTLNYNAPPAAIAYTVNDNGGATSNTATFTVTITGVNDAPVAVNDNTTTPENTPVTLNVTTNDTDVDGTINAATVDLDLGTGGIQTTFSNAAGSWSVAASGVVTFTPALNYSGPASVTYRVNDNSGATSNTGTFAVTITAGIIPPVAVNDNTTTLEDTPVALNVTTNDTDSDGTINAATVDLDPGTGGIQTTFSNAAGGWSVVASGVVTYTPILNYNTPAASIAYTVNDDDGLTSNAGTFTVAITAVNDVPVAVNDATTTTEDTPVTLNVTTNDTDVDGTINAATVDLDPGTGGIQTTFSNAAGSWSVVASGAVTYTPALNFTGPASVTYRVNDNGGATSNTATFTVTITAVNDAPVAVNDNTTTLEDTPVTLNVTTNDTDIDGTINAATVDLDPGTGGIQTTFSNAAGGWSVVASGAVTYTPALNFTGPASVTYRVNDNGGATSNTGTFAVTITAGSTPPVAVNDNTPTTEDTPVALNVTTNDTDVDGTINAATVDLDPGTGGIQTTFSNAAGGWGVVASGVVTYTPTLNYTGPASITYTVNDDDGLTSNAGTFTVAITAVNDVPVAVNDATTTTEDTPVTLNVTTNDTDVDGTINAATVDLDPATGGIQTTFSNAAGGWSVVASGAVTYTPALNLTGPASVTYRVNDNGGATSNTGTFAVAITAANDAPVAVNDNTTTLEDTPVTLNVTTNDTDIDGTINAATVDLDPGTGGIQTTFSNAAGGWSVVASGAVTYTPALNFTGPASVTYRVNDNGGATSNTATFTVAITAVNDAPVAVNDNTTTPENTPVTLNVTTNDTDVDGTINAATVDLDPGTGGIQTTFSNAAGGWGVVASGAVTYTPALNYSGPASVTYRVNDNSGATSNTATFAVAITAGSNPPVAVNDNTTTLEDTPVALNVTTNDTDSDGTINAATVDLDPGTGGIQTTFSNAAGGWSVVASGVVTYTPTLNYNAPPASITYTVNDDDALTSNPGTFTVAITAVNDAPVAVNDNTTTLEDTPVTLNVTTNDTDVDGTINAATVDLDPGTGGIQTTFSNAAGGWSVVASGVVTYTPTPDYTGPASATYRVNDNGGASSNIGTITVSITAGNDAPVAVNDNTTTIEDTPVTLNVTTNDTDDGTINAATVDLDPGTGGIQTTFSNAAGGWSVVASGAVTYTPLLNHNTPAASITYTVNDNNGVTSNEATFTVTITAVNDAPVAVNDNTATLEDTPVTLNVTTNDTDVDGTINAATVDLDPGTGGIQTTFANAAGNWSVVASGAVTYTPLLNYNTPAASITYAVNDNAGVASNAGTITVTITPVNDAPVAVNDNTTTIEDTPVTLNVTTNDTDIDGTINAATVDLDPATGGIQTTFSNAAGSWSVVPSGDVTYTPTLDYTGPASATYRVNDNGGTPSNTGTIAVTITAGNDAPVAANDNTTTNEDTPVTLNVTTNDTDDGTINAATVDLDPGTGGIQTTFSNAAGSWSVVASGVVTYTPILNYNTPAASITYTVNDNDGVTSNEATITVTITAVNDAPVAVIDNTTTNEDTPATLNVTTNDTDVDGTINAGTVDLDPGTGGIQTTFSNAAGSWSVVASGVVT